MKKTYVIKEVKRKGVQNLHAILELPFLGQKKQTMWTMDDSR